jgi:hypothetical protein
MFVRIPENRRSTGPMSRLIRTIVRITEDGPAGTSRARTDVKCHNGAPSPLPDVLAIEVRVRY